MQGKLIVFGAIAGLFVLMGGFVYYASLDNPSLEQAQMHLSNVEITNIDTTSNIIKLKVTFMVNNPSTKTFTVPIINYELFANDKSLGTGDYSTQDIALPGRVVFSPNTTIPLSSLFYLTLDDQTTDVYNIIINDQDVQYSANGIITLETAWSIVEKDFETTLIKN